MDAALRKSSERSAVQEENSVELISDHEESKIFLEAGEGRRGHRDDESGPFSANQCNGKQVLMPRMENTSAQSSSRRSSPSQREVHRNRLQSAKAEMGEAREENQRLKMHLSKIMKDYQTLQMEFHGMVGQETKNPSVVPDQKMETHDDLISLSLGRTSSGIKKEDKPKPNSVERVHDQQDNEGLSLGLHCKFEASEAETTEATSMKLSPNNSLERKEEEAGESSVAHKGVKTMRIEEDEVAQQNPAKKARVSVRIRCDTPTMNDGCQWRKYGQKIAKGNPCPRAYYRCTVSPACPVRKQVQRCAEDMSILITTYEGTHNHPLTASATAMASTTSAAVSMLLSGSSTSNASAGTTNIPNFPGLNFYINHNSKAKPYYLPSSSISSTPSYPTITLDLTSTSTSTSSHFNKITSNFLSAPRYSSATNLNFSSLESNPLPISWSNGVLNYGTQPYNNSQIGSSLNFGRSPQENLYHSFIQKANPNHNPNPNPNAHPPQQLLPADSIAAATKALTSDPTFQSALAAALKSIMGTGNTGGNSTNQTTSESIKFGNNINLGDHFPVVSNFPSSTSNGNKCATSYMSRSSASASSQPGSVVFQQPPLPFPTSNCKPNSPADKDHIV